jgi:hypothetical protein
LLCAVLVAAAGVGITLVFLGLHSWRGTRAKPRIPVITEHPFPRGIVVHHTASAPWVRVGRHREAVNAAVVDRWHGRRGFVCTGPDGRAYHIGYHFLILPDGTVQHGRPETLFGAHARQHNDTLGVCLVGDFDRRDNPRGRKGPLHPSSAQIRSLEGLLTQLMQRYDLTPADVHLHREVVPTTRCPGDSFPAAEVRAAVGNPHRGDHPRSCR